MASGDGRLDRVKKKHGPLAEIAFHYGIDPFGLTASQRIGLLANLPRMQAQEQIQRRDLEGMDYKQVFALYLAAYDDLELAKRARLEFLKSLVFKA